jgi:D-serine deaminase-like pyridoxal phosphate-dependent protein
MAGIDTAAVTALGAQRIDWRFKGLPSSWWGMTPDDVVERGPGLLGDGAVGPLVTLDASALEDNLQTMAAWCRARGADLAPHGKTHMAPQLFARQLQAGACGITAANISQVRVYRAFGVANVLLANQLVDPAGLAWVGAELDRDPEFTFSAWVDSERGVALMDAALATSGVRRRVDVLLEVGERGGRTGCRDDETVHRVASAVRDSPRLRLSGVAGYEGALAHDTSSEGHARVEAYLHRMRACTLRLAEDGAFESDDVVVTAGGSAFFDQVVDVLAQPWSRDLPARVVLRSGAYLTHDDGFYQGISPLTRNGTPGLRSALRLWAQVTSRPEPHLALLTAGKRDASFDEGLPVPQLVWEHGAPAKQLADSAVSAMNDQHTFVSLGPAEADLCGVGSWMQLGLSHPCTVFDKWQLVPVVDADGVVVDLVRTFF